MPAERTAVPRHDEQCIEKHEVYDAVQPAGLLLFAMQAASGECNAHTQLKLQRLQHRGADVLIDQGKDKVRRYVGTRLCITSTVQAMHVHQKEQEFDTKHGSSATYCFNIALAQLVADTRIMSQYVQNDQRHLFAAKYKGSTTLRHNPQASPAALMYTHDCCCCCCVSTRGRPLAVHCWTGSAHQARHTANRMLALPIPDPNKT